MIKAELVKQMVLETRLTQQQTTAIVDLFL
jgi:hypothetical protein